MSKIKVRFNNPRYDAVTKKFKIDVEFQSDVDNEKIFGINTRFFYDSTIFLPSTTSNPKINFIEFATGYFIQNKPINGLVPLQIGKTFFKLPTSPVNYVNWAVQGNANTAPVISTTGWTKLFAVELTSKDVLTGKVCPAFIWDKKNKDAGYIPNQEGVTIITVVNPAGEVTTKSVEEIPVHFNWTATNSSVPFGAPNTSDCVTI